MARMNRDSKTVANTRNQAIINEENGTTDSEEENQIVIDITNNIDEDIANEASRENNFTISQNAPNGLSLDLFKQYKRRVDFCDRDIIKIHDRALNKKDRGFKNNGLIYVDFQAGMFEAVKINVMKFLKDDHGVKLISDPKVEMFGEALERICLDMQMPVGDHTHDVKMKVHNTKCSVDIQAFHETVEQRHDHLNNQTVGEYFAKTSCLLWLLSLS